MPPVERAVAPPDPNARGASYPNPPGWVCPCCHKVWSPYVRTCLNCTTPQQAARVEKR